MESMLTGKLLKCDIKGGREVENGSKRGTILQIGSIVKGSLIRRRLSTISARTREFEIGGGSTGTAPPWEMGTFMTETPKPTAKPANPYFSSGPATKRPGWTVRGTERRLYRPFASGEAGQGEAQSRDRPNQGRFGHSGPLFGRHRSGLRHGRRGNGALVAVGGQKVDLLAWESFGFAWATDVVEQLKLRNVRTLKADYGEIVDLGAVDFNNDVVFAYNGTTSGIRVPGGDWIPGDQGGLVIADATSAVFAMDMPWPKLDVATWSWQKVMGGEAPRHVGLESPRGRTAGKPRAPLAPAKDFPPCRRDGELIAGIFEGETINTPSMLAVEDALDGLNWARSLGGVPALVKRSEDNLSAIANWVEASDWASFLAADPATRSCTSVCLKIIDPWFAGLDENGRAAAVKKITGVLDAEGAAHDIGAHRDAPPGLRIWAGATIEQGDAELLFPWLDWAFAQARAGAGGAT